MDAFSVWHTDRTKCSDLRDQKSDTRNGSMFIKAAVNIFFVSDKFYKVLLVFYSLTIIVSSL